MDVNTYSSSIVLVGGLLLAYRYGKLNPEQLAFSLYRAFIRCMICVEEVVDLGSNQDLYQLIYYDGSKRLKSDKLSFGQPAVPFTHAEFTWRKEGVSGISLLFPGSALLLKLQSGQEPSTLLPLSTFRMISLTGTKTNGEVIDLKPPTAHLVGDILFTDLWKKHFGYQEIRTFQAVDNDVNILNIDEKGFTVN